MIQLTELSGKICYVKASSIICIQYAINMPDCKSVITAPGLYFMVKETPEEILARIPADDNGS